MGKNDDGPDKPGADPDRDAILARRKRFVALALTGLTATTMASCDDGKGGKNDGTKPATKQDGPKEPPPQPCLTPVVPNQGGDGTTPGGEDTTDGGNAAETTDTTGDTTGTDETTGDTTGGDETDTGETTKKPPKPRPCLKRKPPKPRPCLKKMPADPDDPLG